MDDTLSPDDLETVRTSPRAGDRASWHLLVCPVCHDLEESYCPIGDALMAEWELVTAAIRAFTAVLVDQRKLLLEDLHRIQEEDCPC